MIAICHQELPILPFDLTQAHKNIPLYVYICILNPYQRETNEAREMKSLIRKLEQEIYRLTIENNSLKNLIRRQPECRETHEARELVGRRRWEDLSESENSVLPSKTPLYLSSVERVDMSNPARLRKHQAKQSQVQAGFTNVFPIEVE